MSNAASDPRTVPELFEAVFQPDEEEAWRAIAALHWRGSEEVVDRAVGLARSPDALSRARAADILAQVGVPDRTFPERCFSAVLPLLSDDAHSVVFSAIFALQHLDRSRAAAHVIPFAGHEDEDIRHAVACALGAVDTAEAHAVLLRLMTDRDGDVRDWATFGIGQQSDADTSEIREALAARLDDDDADVRYEAIIGLGRRRDRRVIGHLESMLQDDPEDIFACEAAIRLVGFDESGEWTTEELLGALQRLQ